MEEIADATNTVEEQRYLPDDLITQHILTRLPVKSLLQFKSVSKQWNKFYLFSCNSDDSYDISDKNLMKLGFDFRSGEDLVLIGTCNGLVCLASFSGFFFILWNPITDKFKKYMAPDLSLDSPCRVSWGFGTDEYEEIGFSHGEEPIRNPYAFHTRQGVLVDETLYWIVSEVDDFGRKILAFDLALETFNSSVDLDLVSDAVYRDKFLCVMGGCLSKCGMNIRDDMTISMLKGPGKIESIRLSRHLRLRSCQGIVGFKGTGKFYVLLEDSTIGVINPSSKPMKYTPILTWKKLGKSRVASFVPSLIFPSTGV
uniref:F-box domain-containing protein n=1 Tax=Chenopodium quinoa TaxID=63459 RepID=A0A803KVN6_CHEQI